MQVIYNHPELDQLGAPDVNDLGRKKLRLGDVAMLERRYEAALRGGSLLLLPRLARRAELSYNEVQLRAVAKARRPVAWVAGRVLKRTDAAPACHGSLLPTIARRCPPPCHSRRPTINVSRRFLPF